MATRTVPYVTPEQYLEYDRKAEFPSEYLFGEILPIEAATPWHALITMNVGRQLGNPLQGGPCRVFGSTLRVSLDPKKGYVYPDITVVCGKLEYLDSQKDTATNPKLAVEILSPSTMDRDLGRKTRMYWKVASLSDLIFIEQKKIGVEYWHRSAGGDWARTAIEDAGGILQIDSFQCQIPVSEIYDGVELVPLKE